MGVPLDVSKAGIGNRKESLVLVTANVLPPTITSAMMLRMAKERRERSLAASLRQIRQAIDQPRAAELLRSKSNFRAAERDVHVPPEEHHGIVKMT